MLFRILIVATVILISLFVMHVYQLKVFRLRLREGLQLEAYRPGHPAILYFTAPGCSPCEMVQQPVLAAISERFADHIQILTHDASVEIDLARSWGVLTVPTTFLIDALGRPRRVNHGPVGQQTLVDQLEQIGALPGVNNLGNKAAALEVGVESASVHEVNP